MRLQTLIAVLLVAVVATYLVVGRQTPVFTEDRRPSAALDAIGAAEAAEGTSGDTMLVHVSGAVIRPGIVELPAGSRIADAVAAAGGATRSANLTAINLAAPISDGAQLVVPRHGDAGPAVQAQSGNDTTAGLVRLNSATVAELIELPGIGPVLAERIVRHREERGPFVVVEDLLDVAGIGEAKLLELRAFVDL